MWANGLDPTFLLFLKRFLVLACVFPTTGRSQDSTFDNLVDHLLGNWKSVQEACVGIGKAEREYSMVVDGEYLHVINTAYFEPDSSDQTGSVHHDWGIFNYDNIRKMVVLREFNSEGFVITYNLGEVSPDGMTYVFLSETIDNLPAGWRARTTIILNGADRFDELFEVAKPGGEFRTYVKSAWSRE